jgi:diguanylate cyclase (GGDEF)-like protein
VLSRLRPLLRNLRDAVDGAEFRGLARSAADGSWLLLLLAGLYMLAPGSDVARPVLLLSAAALLAAVAVSSRVSPRLRPGTRLTTLGQLLAMIVFISVFLFSTALPAALLLILYLVPVIIAALVLGRWPTFAVTGLSVVALLMAATLRHPAMLSSGQELVELVVVLAPFLLVAFVAALLAHEIEMAKQRIQVLSETDELTGLSNLKAFSRLHRQEHERAIRHRRPYSVIMVDLNGLKQINDDFGPEHGDRAIVLCANVIARLIRATDAAARFGGDEFVVLLSETDAESARQVTNRIRSATERCLIDVEGKLLRLAINVGVASFPDDAEEAREVISVADQAMARDKEARRAAIAETDTPRAEVV